MSINNINTSKIFILALITRFLLVIYSKWHDNNCKKIKSYFKVNLKYTDIDYSVYTDAAFHILKGESPYQRYTYRYTPLM